MTNPAALTLEHPLATCECGCGEPTPLAARTDRRTGHIAGQPIRFINGHQNRWKGPSIEANVDGGYQTSCWRWLRCLNNYGYGLIRVDGKSQLAHRYLYEHARGPVPDGLELDHLCRNRWCVRPAHLEAVTRKENARRGARTVLTADEARAIKESTDTYEALARRFGVAPSTVWNIRSGKNWSDV